MKYLIIGLLLAISSSSVSAFEVFDINDPAYEWSQFKDKKSSALLSKSGLIITNKDNNLTALSTVELSIDPTEDDYIFTVNIEGPKLNDDVNVGMVFDYSDTRNYRSVIISKSQYTYLNVKDGVESVVRTGMIKLKGQKYNLTMDKNGDVAVILLNGLNIATFKRLNIESNVFGVILKGKGVMTVRNFGFEISAKEKPE